MKKTKAAAKDSLENRFEFLGDAVAPGNREALRPTLFSVKDQNTEIERTLKLWKKTGTSVDDDLRELWLHEMRQVQRVMSYAGAREVIVDVLEFVEDDQDFGVVLECVGQPLSASRIRVPRKHWLRNLGSPRARTLFWQNVQRMVKALGIVHAQGLIHGDISADVIMTEGLDEPDFQLGGFEWSLWLSSTLIDRTHARTGAPARATRHATYSFEADWRALGLIIADCLDSSVKTSGEVQANGKTEYPITLNVSERVMLKRLVSPAKTDLLDADSIVRSIDDLIASVARSVSTRAGTFVLAFDRQSRLGEAVYDATNGEIPVDEHRRHIEWVQSDLDCGATLLVPRSFDSKTGSLRLVTETMIYRLRAYRDEGSPVWDIAICQNAELRQDRFNVADDDEHAFLQPVFIAASPAQALEMRGRLGPDALDWSALARPLREAGSDSEAERIRRALMLVQIIEAVVKALDVYPVEILDRTRQDGRRLIILRAEPGNDRDRIAKRVGLSETAVALKRLFEEEHQDAEAKWRLSQAASLGATRSDDTLTTFVDVVDHQGRHAYVFEADAELPSEGRFFLRTERDTGTEAVIARRLRNIKALDTRVDLAEMFSDPWRVRRSSRESLSDDVLSSNAFLDLDVPKQEALKALWATLPSFSVVGPPGVGKTKLATEVVRLRFKDDRSTRMLVSAQGHDALDNLQEKIVETLTKEGLSDVMVVRSSIPERRQKSDEEVNRVSLDYLTQLLASALSKNAPSSIQVRISELKEAAYRSDGAKETVTREQRSGLGAISNLVLDAANIVMSTANSPDIERMVEAREQFDWVVIEEASKATGPELVGALMLSGRRLLIGDHHQLPPHDADRLVKILSDHALVSEALGMVQQLLSPLLRDGELDELELIVSNAEELRTLAGVGLRLLEPFRTLVEEDERRARSNTGHRPITATLTEQRRMDPAIAEIVSKAFYGGRLTTESKRAAAAQTNDPPFIQLGPLPRSPVVVVDFPHASSSGSEADLERARPRWHNPSEAAAVVDVLRHLRARDLSKPPSLAILSPYKAQVDKLRERITAANRDILRHLDQFVPARSNIPFVGTVDAFQGSEADIVVLSLVRHNPRTGGSALGFLRDSRRMNVALSRAKYQLIIVGSLAFLREAVRGVNPDALSHDLTFLTDVVDAIGELAKQERNGIKLATLIDPAALKNSSI